MSTPAEELLVEIQALIAARNKAPQLLTIKEAAKYLAVSESTIRRWINLQKIPVVRFDDTVRLNVEDLKKLVKACTQQVHEIWRSQPPSIRVRRRRSA